MSRGSYSQGKRQREIEKARKKKEKAERRAQRRERGPAPDEYVSVEEITGSLPSIAEVMHDIENPKKAPRSATVPCRLFVGGLSWNTTDESLLEAFSEYGDVVDCAVITDMENGRSRGFGFVTMADRRDAQRAIKGLNDQELDGRTIVVNVATERQR